MQKLKSQILKTVSKNQQERLSNMNMIKKCEKIIAEIIEIAESLNLNQSSFLWSDNNLDIYFLVYIISTMKEFVNK